MKNIERSSLQTLLQSALYNAVMINCKNLIAEHHSISVEGLIGITLQNNDVILVNINSKVPPLENMERRSSSPIIGNKRKCKFPQKVLKSKISNSLINETDQFNQVPVSNLQRSMLMTSCKIKKGRRSLGSNTFMEDYVDNLTSTNVQTNHLDHSHVDQFELQSNITNEDEFIDESESELDENTNENGNASFEDSTMSSVDQGENINTMQVFNPEVLCPICLKEFSNKGNLRRHLRHIHSHGKFDKSESIDLSSMESQEKVQKINESDQNTSLISNTSLPSNQSPRCIFCGKIFSNSGNLRRHVKLHSENGSAEALAAKIEQAQFSSMQIFTCPNCSKEFSTMGNLRRHMKLTDECRESGLMPISNKNYSCDKCGKSFVNGGNLKRHQKTHDLAKNLKCTNCKAEFYAKDELIVHESFCRLNKEGADQGNIISNDFKICRICGLNFEDEDKMRLHHLQAHAFSKKKKFNNRSSTAQYDKNESCETESC